MMTDAELLEQRLETIKRLNASIDVKNEQIEAHEDTAVRLNSTIEAMQDVLDTTVAENVNIKAKNKALHEDEDAEYQDLFKVCKDLEIKVMYLKEDYRVAMSMLEAAKSSSVGWRERSLEVGRENREWKSLIKSVGLLLASGQIDHAKELLV